MMSMTTIRIKTPTTNRMVFFKCPISPALSGSISFSQSISLIIKSLHHKKEKVKYEVSSRV